MNANPIWEASLAIQIHLVAAVAAFVLGAFVLWRRKGTKRHKHLGKVWAGLMGVVIVSSLFISQLRTIGPFSPIHLLSLGSAIGLIYALIQIRRGRIEHHRRAMQGLYFGGLVVAGSMAFAPNRILHRMVFGDGALEGFTGVNPVGLALGSALLAFLVIYGWSRLRAGRGSTGGQ